MKSLNIDDWYELKKVARTRLGPNEISGWFAASLMYSLVILGTSIFALVQGAYLNKEFWKPIVIVAGVLFITQVIIGVFFSNMRNIYDHQKILTKIVYFFNRLLRYSAYLFFPSFEIIFSNVGLLIHLFL